MIVLMGEAVYLFKEGVVDNVHGVGFPPLRQLMDNTIGQNVPFYLCMPCSMARGVTDEDIEGKNAQFAGPADPADLTMEADRVLSF